MQFTYYGQAGFQVVVNGKKLLFDPFVSGNPLAQHIDVKSIMPDFILVSHGHGDHIADVATIAKQSNALVITNPEIHAYLEKQGVTNVHELNHGSPVPFDFGKVRAVNAIHSSGLPDGSYGGNPMGFVITSNEKNFYFAGDTALTMDMQLIPLFGKMDFAVFPIGGNYTMDHNDAVVAADFSKVDRVVGVHYNTFPYITIDTNEAVETFKSKGKELLLPAVGETIVL
ncbi:MULTISPECIES: metal-dependent hydrolase [Chitinophagaceae]